MDRIRRPSVLLLLAPLTVALIVFRGAPLSSWAAAALFLVVIFGIPFTAKAINSRVVIGSQYVESRDALRRSRRCDRNSLAKWVTTRRFGLTKILLVDEAGRAQLSLAWDSFSDVQLEQIRTALNLPVEPK